MSVSSANELMIKAVSQIGKARNKSQTNPKEALLELDYAISLMGDAVSIAFYDIDIRKERLKHCVGITINSPKDLHSTIQEDLSFFREYFDKLTTEDRCFYYFIAGNFQIYAGNRLQGKDMLKKCISLIPSSLEAIEAQLILDSLD